MEQKHLRGYKRKKRFWRKSQSLISFIRTTWVSQSLKKLQGCLLWPILILSFAMKRLFGSKKAKYKWLKEGDGKTSLLNLCLMEMRLRILKAYLKPQPTFMKLYSPKKMSKDQGLTTSLTPNSLLTWPSPLKFPSHRRKYSPQSST